MDPTRILLTAGPLVNAPGNLPTTPISRELAQILLDAGKQVRVLIEGEQATGWPAGVEVVAGSSTRPGATPAAFAGIDALVLAGAAPTTVYEAVQLATTGGARKIVTLTSHGPDYEIALPPDQWHWLAIEVVVERSGLAWCHIVPSLVMAVTLTGSYPLLGPSWRDLIVRGQPIQRPYADAGWPMIHERDLAAIVAAALGQPAFDGTRVHAAGRLVSDAERMHTLRDVLDADILFERLTPEQARRMYQDHGLADEEIDYVLDTAAWFAAHGEETHAEAERILGRPLIPFAAWVREHAAAFSSRRHGRSGVRPQE